MSRVPGDEYTGEWDTNPWDTPQGNEEDYPGGDRYFDSYYQDRTSISNAQPEPQPESQPVDLTNLAINTPWDTQGLTDLYDEYIEAGGITGWTAYTGNLTVDFFANIWAWAQSPNRPDDISSANDSGLLPPEGNTLEEVNNMTPGGDNNTTPGGGAGSDRDEDGDYFGDPNSGTDYGSPGEIGEMLPDPEGVENIDLDPGGEGKMSLEDLIYDSIQHQTGMSKEQWGIAKPFYEQIFSPEGLARIDTAQGQGFDALTQLFGDVTTESPFDKAMTEMGITGAKTATDIMSGDFELPPWMQDASDDRWDTAVEGMTRGGIDPWRSTAGAQQRSRFNVGEGKIKTDYGLGMLGMTGPLATNAFGALNQNKNNEYATLFGGGQSLVNPMYGAAGGLAASSAGNISGAANIALSLINSNRTQREAKRDNKDGTGDWDAIWEGINQGYTTFSGLDDFDWGF